MMLAKPRRVVTIVDKNVADRTGALGQNGIIARIARGEFRDVAKAHSVMVAAGEKRGARGRAQRSGVKVVVTKAACCHAIQGRGWNRPAEGAGCTEARIVSQDQQNVWSAFGSCNPFGKVRFGLAGLAANDAAKQRLRNRENYRTFRRRVLCECARRESNEAAKYCRDRGGFK